MNGSQNPKKDVPYFYQLKAIRKGTKPPVWRRIYVPADISFAQLAAILEEVLNFCVLDAYEFEFYGSKERLLEMGDTEELPHDFYYTYLEASDHYVRNRLENEKWFTFRCLRSSEEETEYRVETEKPAAQYMIGDGKEAKTLRFPMILKQKTAAADPLWAEPEKVNTSLEKWFFLTESDARYQTYDEVIEEVRHGKGIGISRNAADREDRTVCSAASELSRFGDAFFEKVVEDKINSLRSELEIDDETGEILSDTEKTAAAAARVVREAKIEMRKAVEDELEKRLAQSSVFNEAHRKPATIEALLCSFTVQDLRDIADEIGFRPSAKKKKGIAFELARKLLNADTMRMRLLEVDEEVLDSFEKAMNKGYHLPDEAEMLKLEEAESLCYIACFTNDMMEVPEEVKLVYETLKRNGYRAFHRKVHWLIMCMRAFELIHVTAPVQVFLKMYRQNPDCRKVDLFEIRELLTEIPEKDRRCTLTGNRFVFNDVIQKQLYLDIERIQRGDDYYIPTRKEILEYARYGYPASDEAYRKLYGFYSGQMELDDDTCVFLCRAAFMNFTNENTLSDYADILNEMELSFDSYDELEKWAQTVLEANNHSRMFFLKGHTPDEIFQQSRPLIHRGKSKIVPMSTEAANIMREYQSEFERIGFQTDPDSTADTVPIPLFPDSESGNVNSGRRKIYPNDPCPCGSGKKYKHCCGRKK